MFVFCLLFAVLPLQCLSFLQHTAPQKEQSNKQQQRTKLKLEKQENLKTKHIAYPKLGRCKELGPGIFLVCVLFKCLVNLPFAVSCEGLAGPKK